METEEGRVASKTRKKKWEMGSVLILVEKRRMIDAGGRRMERTESYYMA